MLIYVKGYDRKFKGSNSELLLEEGLKQSSIYSLFKDDITSITFEFSVFKGGKIEIQRLDYFMRLGASLLLALLFFPQKK